MATKVERYDEAIALDEDGKSDEALAKMEVLANDEPGYALAHAALSVFYGRQNRFEEGLKHAETVCQLEPDDPFSFVAKSLIAQQAGKLAEAEEAMAKARQVEFLAQQAAEQNKTAEDGNEE